MKISFDVATGMTKSLAILILAMFTTAPSARPAAFDRIVAFGSSLSDTGNSFYWLSLPENQACGIPVTKPPYTSLDSLLIPEGPYDIGGRRYAFSNGPIWLEGFARYLALARSARPAFASNNKLFTNYSVGGARAIAKFPCRVNLPEQVQNYFLDYRRTSDNTLVTLEFGANDVKDALFAAAQQQDPMPYIDSAVKSIYAAMNSLYSHGARRFMVMNVPDLGKTPAVRMVGASGSATILTNVFNNSLLAVLKNIQKLPGSKVKVLDVNKKFDDIAQRAPDYGFSNSKDPCIRPKQQCSNPDAYIFWDGIHPTRALHALIAQQAVGAVSRH